MKLKLPAPTADSSTAVADAGTLTFEPVSPNPVVPSPASAGSTRSRSSRLVLAAAALIVLAGGAIRFGALSTSLWFDESVSVRDVSGSFGQMLHRVVNHEASPPFYFVCLWIWRQLVGSTAVDLRALSALAGTMAIALAFYVARRRLGVRPALFLAAAVAVSPALVYYSTEMRMYALLILITGVGFEAFLRASDAPNPRNLSVWAVASLLAVWSQYYAALAVAPQAALLIAMAYRRRPRSGPTLLAAGGLALGALPLLYLLPYQARHAFAYGGPLLSSVWHRIPTSIHVDSTVSAITQSLVVGPGGPARALLTALVVLIGIVAVALLVRRHQTTRAQLIWALCLITPAVLAVEAMVLLHILVEGRYLLPFWLPVGLATSYALTSASAGWLGLGLAGLLICIWLVALVLTLTVPKLGARDDTLGAARRLGVAGANRLIAINEPWDVLTMQQYRPQASLDTKPVVRVRELDVVAMPPWAEPAPTERPRPSSVAVGVVPRGLRLAQVIRGGTFLVERFVAARPVAIRVDGRGSAFTAGYWRFLTEPAGGHLGAL